VAVPLCLLNDILYIVEVSEHRRHTPLPSEEELSTNNLTPFEHNTRNNGSTSFDIVYMPLIYLVIMAEYLSIKIFKCLFGGIDREAEWKNFVDLIPNCTSYRVLVIPILVIV
jgi:hypothetical protein